MSTRSRIVQLEKETSSGFDEPRIRFVVEDIVTGEVQIVEANIEKPLKRRRLGKARQEKTIRLKQ